MLPVRAGSPVGVLCVETRLRQLGRISYTADSTLDTTSVAALRSFQAETGLATTGVGDVATLRALGIWRDPPSPGCTVSVTVRSGSRLGTRCVETRLRQLGLTAQTPDDTFTAASVNALRAYQYLLSLPVDGVAGPQTLSRLGVWRAPPVATCTVSVTVRSGSFLGAACVDTRLRQLRLVGAGSG